MIFVFGSNLAGLHGAGAAKFAAKNKGAIHGQGIGLMGECYALPTKNHQIKTLPFEHVKIYIQDFINFAEAYFEMKFQVTRVGCGLAGFTDAQIAPLFKDAPSNCYFDDAWQVYLGDGHKYWGGLRR